MKRDDVKQSSQLAKDYNRIRQKAVKSLESRSTDDIHSIMLQLVQAYRYENFEDSKLKDFLLNKVFDNIYIANSFHWLLHLEKENDETNPGPVHKQYQELYDKFMKQCQMKHREIFDSIFIQNTFRVNTLKTAMTVRNSKEKNEG